MTNGQYTLSKGTVHVPGETEQASKKFHHATQNSAQFETNELFIFEIFHLMLSDCRWLWLTETETGEGGTEDKKGLLY